MSAIPSDPLRATDFLELIGNTPVVKIHHVTSNPKVQIFAKLEARNPGGSVKDRICKAMIQAAEQDGLLGPTLIASSWSQPAATPASAWP